MALGGGRHPGRNQVDVGGRREEEEEEERARENLRCGKKVCPGI